MLDTLQSIDPTVLAEVVRQDQCSQQFEITDWTVRRLSDQGIINPDGLFLFSGHGNSGSESTAWSVVLKILRDPGKEQDQDDMWYWNREFKAFQSGLLAQLAGPVVAPRYYGSMEISEGVGLWMEHILETAPPRWTVEHYACAAQKLGQFNGAYLNETPLPDYPWLSRGLTRSWSQDKAGNLDKAWQNPVILQTFSERLYERCRQVCMDQEKFYTVLDRLPQVFSHFDSQRRNLFLRKRKDGQEELVAVDWALCGIGALGGELNALVGMSLFLGEPDLMQSATRLDQSVFEAYISGLQESGWHGNPDLARLGYAAWTAMYVGASAPAATSSWTSATSWWTKEEADAFALKQFGKMGKELAFQWASVCEFGLDRADEAYVLMEQLELD